MARIWTSPNSCEYVPEDVYLTVEITQPVPEPDIDNILKEINETCADYTARRDGVGCPMASVSEDFTYEDNPTVIIDDVMYATLTGKIDIYNFVEDEKVDDFIDEIDAILQTAGVGKINDIDRHACY